jgi:hypothetical protein
MYLALRVFLCMGWHRIGGDGVLLYGYLFFFTYGRYSTEEVYPSNRH